MARIILVMLTVCLTLSACGRISESRLNPFNWFGRDRDEQVVVADEALLRDPRPFVSQVVSLQVDPTPEGAIIRVVGLPPVQGYYNAELLEVDTGNPATLTYEFRVTPPPYNARQSTTQSREILIGQAVSNRRLAEIRSITVVGQNNRRSVRR